MKIEVNYFGMLAEVTGRASEHLEISKISVAELKQSLFEKYPDLQQKDFRIAQNQELVSDETLLTGQEIAVLPPFSGG